MYLEKLQYSHPRHIGSGASTSIRGYGAARCDQATVRLDQIHAKPNGRCDSAQEVDKIHKYHKLTELKVHQDNYHR